MSILIRGMEMPKNCDVCFMCDACEYSMPLGKRLADCPLIEVPMSHGRLIDADALGIRDAEKQAYEAYLMEKHEYFIEEPLLEYKRGLNEGLIHASGLVRFAPTIIPAEEG